MRRRSDPARRLPRSLIPLMAHAVITQGTIFVVRPTISYRALEIGLDSTLIGVLAGAFTLVPLLIAIPLGTLSDRVGERRLMLAGPLGMVLAIALIAGIGHGVWVLAAASVLLGASHLAAAIGQQAMVGALVPRSRLSAAFAYYSLTGAIGQTFAPGLIALFGAGRTIPDTQAIFLVVLALSACAIPIVLLLPRRSTSREEGAPSRLAVGQLLRLKGLPSAIAISGIVLAAIDVFTVYLPVLGLERGYTAGTVSLLLVIRAATSMASRILLEPMQLAFGPNRLLLGTVLLAVAAMAAVPLVDLVLVLALLMVPLGLGLGLAQPITMAWVAAIAPPGLRGSMMSLRLTGNRLAQTAMPAIAGSVAGTMGSSGVLWVLTLSLGVSAVAARRVDVNVGEDKPPGGTPPAPPAD